MTEKNPYEDILHCPHPISTRHAAMTKLDRAAQFAPFAALTGYEDAISEEARLTEPKICQEESCRQDLDRVCQYLQNYIKERPMITVTYFQPDARKTGGAYRKVTQRLKQLDEYDRCLVLCTGQEISMEDIVAIEAENIVRRKS